MARSIKTVLENWWKNITHHRAWDIRFYINGVGAFTEWDPEKIKQVVAQRQKEQDAAHSGKKVECIPTGKRSRLINPLTWGPLVATAVKAVIGKAIDRLDYKVKPGYSPKGNPSSILASGTKLLVSITLDVSPFLILHYSLGFSLLVSGIAGAYLTEIPGFVIFTKMFGFPVEALIDHLAKNDEVKTILTDEPKFVTKPALRRRNSVPHHMLGSRNPSNIQIEDLLAIPDVPVPPGSVAIDIKEATTQEHIRALSSSIVVSKSKVGAHVHHNRTPSAASLGLRKVSSTRDLKDLLRLANGLGIDVNEQQLTRNNIAELYKKVKRANADDKRSRRQKATRVDHQLARARSNADGLRSQRKPLKVNTQASEAYASMPPQLRDSKSKSDIEEKHSAEKTKSPTNSRARQLKTTRSNRTPKAVPGVAPQTVYVPQIRKAF